MVRRSVTLMGSVLLMGLGSSFGWGGGGVPSPSSSDVRADASPLPQTGSSAMAPEGIALGAKVFQVRCIECHGEKGVGGSAPSLLQSERVKRATHEELVKLIGDGALSKGMPPWRRRIKDDELKAVSAYVFSLGKLKQ